MAQCTPGQLQPCYSNAVMNCGTQSAAQPLQAAIAAHPTCTSVQCMHAGWLHGMHDRLPYQVLKQQTTQPLIGIVWVIQGRQAGICVGAAKIYMMYNQRVHVHSSAHAACGARPDAGLSM
jgi:hypothetical protein